MKKRILFLGFAGIVLLLWLLGQGKKKVKSVPSIRPPDIRPPLISEHPYVYEEGEIPVRPPQHDSSNEGGNLPEML